MDQRFAARPKRILQALGGKFRMLLIALFGVLDAAPDSSLFTTYLWVPVHSQSLGGIPRLPFYPSCERITGFNIHATN